MLLSGELGNPHISGHRVVYTRARSGQQDVMLYDLLTGIETNLTESPADEWDATIEGDRVAYVVVDGDNERVDIMDLSQDPPTVISGMVGGANVFYAPQLSASHIAWDDGRNVSVSEGATGNYDVAYAPLSGPGAFPQSAWLTLNPAAQVINDIEGQTLILTDYRRGDWNIAIAQPGDSDLTLITESDAQQWAPAASGERLVWMDDRNGTFDIYTARISSLATDPTAASLRIQEVFAAPVDTDTNGDGVRDPVGDEFVEIRNISTMPVSLAGATFSDSAEVRYAFADDVVLPAGGVFLIYGSGSIDRWVGGAQADVTTLTAEALSLDDTGDTLTLRSNTGVVLDTLTYDSLANNNEALQRTPGDVWVLHSTLPDAIGRFSGGMTPQGYGF